MDGFGRALRHRGREPRRAAAVRVSADQRSAGQRRGLALGPGYDNDNPRESLSKLEGWRQRAHFAQQNGHEAFAPFAAAVVLAHAAHAPQLWLTGLACLFLVARVGHGAAYVAGSGGWRSGLWWCGFACTVGLLGAAFVSALQP